MTAKERFFSEIYPEKFESDANVRTLIQLKVEDIGERFDEATSGFIPLEISLSELVESLWVRGFKVLSPGEFRLIPTTPPVNLRNLHAVKVFKVECDENGQDCYIHCILLGENPLSNENTAYVADTDFKAFISALQHGPSSLSLIDETSS